MSCACRPVAVGRHLQRALRVGGRGVHPERQHDRLGADARARRRRAVRPRRARASSPLPGASGTLLVGASRRPAPALVGEAHVVREPAGARVHVHAAVVDIRPVVEDRLRAVAVMRVDVEHGDALGASLAQGLRREGRVVEVARAAVAGRPGVVAGRPAQRVRGRSPRRPARPPSGRSRRRRGSLPSCRARPGSWCRSRTGRPGRGWRRAYAAAGRRAWPRSGRRRAPPGPGRSPPGNRPPPSRPRSWPGARRAPGRARRAAPPASCGRRGQRPVRPRRSARAGSPWRARAPRCRLRAGRARPRRLAGAAGSPRSRPRGCASFAAGLRHGHRSRPSRGMLAG